MAEPKEQGFLDDIEEAAAEEQAATDAEISPQEAEIDALRTERDALQDKFMRALADAENARKRSDRDRREAENYGSAKIVRDMLPVHDNLTRALDTVTEEQRQAASALVEGIELTLRELLHVFEKHNITIIDPQVGDRFDRSITRRCSRPPCRVRN